MSKTSLGYIVSSRPPQTIRRDPLSKNRNKNKKQQKKSQLVISKHIKVRVLKIKDRREKSEKQQKKKNVILKEQ